MKGLSKGDHGARPCPQRCYGRIGTRAAVLVLAMMVGLSGPAMAAIDVLTVTATKRAESLQSVGVSVNAFTGDAMEKLGIHNSDEVLLRVPNLEIQANNGSTNANIFIRGLGTTGPGFNTLSGVGIYSDEVSLNSPVVNILQVYDLERIEILRGPQNTLYGRNTTGGAVNFISRKPEIGGEANGYVRATYGRFNQADIEGAFGAPLGEKMAFRAALQAQYRDGIRNNPFLGTKDFDREKWAGRLQLAFQPTDHFDATVKIHGERVRGSNLRWKSVGLRDPDNPSQPCALPITLGSGCGDINGFADTDNPRENFANLVDPANNVDAFGASLHMNYEFGNGIVVTSITAYEENDYENQEDSDASPNTIFHFNQVSEAEQISQEIRVKSADEDRFRWIVGAYGFWEDTSGSTGPIFAAMNMVNMTQLDLDTEVYSIYGEVEYDVTEKVTVVGGLRYSHDKITGTNNTAVRFFSEVGQFLTPTDGQDTLTWAELVSFPFAMGRDIFFDLEDSWNEWGGKVGLEYQATDDIFVYANVSRGFKGGNFSAAPLQAIAGTAGMAVDPEIVVNYELGFKSELIDNTLTFNLSAFYADYTNQQVLRLTDSPGFGLAAALVNVGGSEIYGIEADIAWAPIEGLFFDVNLGWLQTKITDFTDDDGNDFAGNKLANAPSFNIMFSARYEYEFGSGALLGFGGDISYTSRRQFDLSNNPLLSDGGYMRLNLQAYYEFGPDNNYRVILWGKNITNELWLTNKSDFSSNGFLQVIPSEPATYGLTISANF